MLLHLYQKWQISYVLWVTNYWYALALAWVELWPSIWIFCLKLRIMGISLIYLRWVPFSSSTLVYCQFSDFHLDCFLSCWNNRSGLNFFQYASYWDYLQSHVGYYNFRFYSSFLCEACFPTCNLRTASTQNDCWALLGNHCYWSDLCNHI